MALMGESIRCIIVRFTLEKVNENECVHVFSHYEEM